jgi:hypothetical protein
MAEMDTAYRQCQEKDKEGNARLTATDSGDGHFLLPLYEWEYVGITENVCYQ